jgi:hypothetical protein
METFSNALRHSFPGRSTFSKFVGRLGGMGYHKDMLDKFKIHVSMCVSMALDVADVRNAMSSDGTGSIDLEDLEVKSQSNACDLQIQRTMHAR